MDIDGLTDVWDDGVLIIIGGLTDVVMDVLTVAMLGVGVDLLIDLGIMAVATTVIDLEFAVGISCDVDVMAGVWAGVIIGVVTDMIGVDVLNDMNVNGLTGVMTVLDFALPSP